MRRRIHILRPLLETVLILCALGLAAFGALWVVAPAGLAASEFVVGVPLLMLLAWPVALWRLRRRQRTHPFAAAGSPVGRRWATSLVAGGITVTGLAMTAVAAMSTARATHEVARANFDRLTERLSQEAERRVNQTRYGLAAIRGLHLASESVDLRAFEVLVASRDLPSEFPGAIGFGFIERVERKDLEAFTARQIAGGRPDFAVYGLAESGSALAEAEDLYVITHCFPRERNASAWGLDIGSERNRRDAAERAVNTGEPAISGKIVLVQDGQKQTAFLYYVPVYRVGTSPATPEERRAALVGLAYAPIILAEALAGSAEAVEDGLAFEIHDGLELTADSLLHVQTEADGGRGRSEQSGEARSPMFSARTPLHIGGRTWTMSTNSTPAFERAVDDSVATVIGLGGSLLSLVTGGLVFSLLGARGSALQMATTMTSDLARAKAVAEEAVRETTAFRSTLDKHSIISVADRSGRIIDANRKFCEISGYPLEELLHQDHRILNSGVHPRSFWVEVWRTLSRGEAWRGEICNRARDGSLYWVDSIIAPLTNPDGKIEKYVSIRTDVTTRKQGEAELLEVAERLELATRAGGVGIWDFDPRTNRLTWDEQMYRLYGVDPEGADRTVDVWLNGTHPEDRTRCQEELQAALDGVADFDTEFRVVRPDGTVRSIRAMAVVQRDAEGDAVRMVGTNWDATDQREAAMQLKAASESLEEAQAVARMGNWAFDLATGTVSWSRQLFVMFGRDESLGAPDYAAVLSDYDEESAARLSAAVQAAAEHGTPYSLVLRTASVSATAKFVRGEGRARRDADGRIAGLFGTVMDVTAEIEGAESLKLARAQAEAASRAKSAFLANMSHEIRTPLTAILGFADVLQDEHSGMVEPEQRAQAVETIRNAGQHLLTIINDILDLSKIEADKMTVERTDTPLAVILSEVESLMRPHATGKGIELHTTLETPVPEQIRSDPTRLRQILMNLVGNAVKFTEQGSVTVNVMALQHADGGEPRLIVDIRDTGPGMTELQAGRLFQAFEQANETVTRQHGGTGLGLTICRRLAALMGGSVALHRTQMGVGSVFRVDLPLEIVPGSPVIARLQERSLPDAAEARAAAGIRLAGRILLAEDGIDNQRLIAFHLRKAGATVEIADNGRIALERLAEAEAAGEPFDVLLTDMQMPEMDGYTLARTLRERGSTLPIIAITAHAMAEDRARCEAAGCDDYASKPVDRHELLATCATWLSKQRGSGDGEASRAA